MPNRTPHALVVAIEAHRVKVGLSMDAAAEAAGITNGRFGWCRYVSGGREPSVGRAADMARAVGLELRLVPRKKRAKK